MNFWDGLYWAWSGPCRVAFRYSIVSGIVLLVLVVVFVRKKFYDFPDHSEQLRRRKSIALAMASLMALWIFTNMAVNCHAQAISKCHGLAELNCDPPRPTIYSLGAWLSGLATCGTVMFEILRRQRYHRSYQDDRGGDSRL